MTKLTDTQLVVLSSACRRDDGSAIRPENLKPAGAAKLASSLIGKGLVREIRAKAGVPVWREDESGRYALKILKAGREAIGVEDEVQDTVDEVSTPAQQIAGNTRQSGRRAKGRGTEERAAEAPVAATSVASAIMHLTKPAKSLDSPYGERKRTHPQRQEPRWGTDAHDRDAEVLH